MIFPVSWTEQTEEVDIWHCWDWDHIPDKRREDICSFHRYATVVEVPSLHSSELWTYLLNILIVLSSSYIYCFSSCLRILFLLVWSIWIQLNLISHCLWDLAKSKWWMTLMNCYYIWIFKNKEREALDIAFSFCYNFTFDSCFKIKEMRNMLNDF